MVLFSNKPLVPPTKPYKVEFVYSANSNKPYIIT